MLVSAILFTWVSNGQLTKNGTPLSPGHTVIYGQPLCARGHLDKHGSEGSVGNITIIAADWSWFWPVTSGNRERTPDESVTVTKSRRSPPETGEKELGVTGGGWERKFCNRYLRKAADIR